MATVKVTKTLKMNGKTFERGEKVDLPAAQAGDYVARHLAVPEGTDLPPLDGSTKASDVTTQPASTEGDALLDKEGNLLPPWTLKLTPIQYVDRFDAGAANTDLANQYIDAGHGEHTATLN